jgi:hypothetical protein
VDEWINQPNEQHLIQRINLALKDPRLKGYQERTAALGVLLQCELVVLEDLIANDIGSFIQKHILQDVTKYELELSEPVPEPVPEPAAEPAAEPITTNHTINCLVNNRMTLSFLAQELQARIVLFKSSTTTYLQQGLYLFKLRPQGGNLQQPAVLRKFKRVSHGAKINLSEKKFASLRKLLDEAR